MKTIDPTKIIKRTDPAIVSEPSLIFTKPQKWPKMYSFQRLSGVSLLSNPEQLASKKKNSLTVNTATSF